MNAIEFIKKYSIENAREVVNGAPIDSTHFNYLEDHEYDHYVIIKPEWSEKNKHGYFHKDAITRIESIKFMANVFAGYDMLAGVIDLSDLKRILESIDLIRKVGDVSNAKLILSDMDYDSIDWDEDQFSYYRLLERAISDYELINEVK